MIQTEPITKDEIKKQSGLIVGLNRSQLAAGADAEGNEMPFYVPNSRQPKAPGPIQLNEFGELLHLGWLTKKSLSDKISNSNIEKFYLTSQKFGVLGGKLLGAGGGGHLLLYSEPNKKSVVIQELERIGGQIVNFHFFPNGLEVWEIK